MVDYPEGFTPADDPEETPQYPEGFTPLKERVRPSDPFKQGVAGLTDVATGLPMVLGMAGTGMGTLFDRDDDPETGFGQEFVQNLATNPVFNFGARGREHVNKFLGIEEPISIEDQGARLLTSLVIPGMGPLAALSKGGMLANAARLATPVVKITPGATKANVARLGLQGGLGLGIDQGVRGVMQAVAPDSPAAVLSPPIFSESALKGVEADKYSKAMGALGLGGTTPTDVNVDYPEGFTPQTFAEAALDQDAEAMPESADLDRKIRNDNWANDIGNTLTATAVTATIVYAMRKSQAARRAPSQMDLFDNATPNPVKKAVDRVNEIIDDSPEGTGQLELFDEIATEAIGATKEAAKEAKTGIGRWFDKLNERTTNADAAVKRELLEAGTPEEQADKIIGQGNVDTFGSVIETIRDGVLLGGRKTIPLKEVSNQYNALDKRRQAVFNDGVASLREDRVRDVATDAAIAKGKDPGLDEFGEQIRVKPGLWSKSGRAIEDDEIAINIARLRDDTELWAMAQRLARINEDVLDEAVKRGMLDVKTANAFKDQFTSTKWAGKGEKGMLFYMPGKSTTERTTWYDKILQFAGRHSDKSKEMEGAKYLEAQSLESRQGVRQPVDPIHATADYIYHMTDAINKNNAQVNILKRLANVEILKDGTVAIKGTPITGNVRYIGSLDRSQKSYGDVVWRQKNTDDSVASARIGSNEESGDLRKFFGDKDDVMVVQVDGRQHAFLVSDPFLRTSMRFNHKLTGKYEQFFNQWKNNFTQVTTGNLSPFAPISFAYNQQLATVNAMSRYGLKEGGRTWLDGFKGAYEMFSVNAAREISDILTRNLSQNKGMFVNMAPEAVAKFNERLQRRIANSLVVPVQRSSGKLATSLSSSEYSGNLTNILETAVPHIRDTYGANALPLMWRLWNHLNSSLHEGVALGRIIRKVEESGMNVTDKGFDDMVRAKVKTTKDLVGDVSRRGNTDMSRYFHASVPFSGAMLQAWATLGSAIRKNPVKFTSALITTMGIPTAMEVSWNNMIDPDARFTDFNNAVDPMTGEAKQWSYKDYYWNGFTTDQRNNNRIMFIPGKPPWEAVLIPISPEFSLFRSVVIEGMDELFGMSNVGNSGETGENGDHWHAALSRVLEIPVPPPIAVGFAAASGKDLRIGYNRFFAPGEGISHSFISGRPIGVARVGASAGINKDVGDEFDAKATQVLYDLFGAGATTAVAVAEAFYGGRDDQPRGPIADRLSNAFGAATESIRKQARWTQPLPTFGKALSPSPNNEIASQVYAAKDTLKRMADDHVAISTQGQALNVSGAPVGNVVSVSQDPIYHEVASQAKLIRQMIAPGDEVINRLRTTLSTLENATEFQGEVLTPKRKRDIIDSLKLQISNEQARQLIILKDVERNISDKLSAPIEQGGLGREVNIKLSELTARDR